jgi:uncharacterized protein YbjT (DUF2867 family)
LEQKLNSVGGLNTLHLRAGDFMENTLVQARIMRATGGTARPLRPDLKLPMICSRDISAAAAEELLRLGFRGHQTRELRGQHDLSYDEATSIIGRAIGKPDLKYAQSPADQFRPALASMGMSDNYIGLLLEMTAALNSGYMKPLERRSPAKHDAHIVRNFRRRRVRACVSKVGRAA